MIQINDGQAKWGSAGDKGPFAHNAFWRGDNFSALYTTHPTATAQLLGTRMDLVQDDQGKLVKKGQISDPLVHWVTFDVGGKAEAHALADEVAEGKPKNLTTVDASGKLSITWGPLKIFGRDKLWTETS